ncbi:hypothetical protein [Sphingomonas lacusdianchii]|uniref:hypothetical protein n=1 Tax=Sphingomonas lacusdianchii TaxID=2917992 RepID=UPI001F574645|nr:hypothetical protein [Sphingomonas sp. JXJ CY 53]
MNNLAGFFNSATLLRGSIATIAIRFRHRPYALDRLVREAGPVALRNGLAVSDASRGSHPEVSSKSARSNRRNRAVNTYD